MYAWAYMYVQTLHLTNPHVFTSSYKATLMYFYGKLPPVAPYVNALVFIMFFSTSLYATPYFSMCITKLQKCMI